jgi:uncharacterized protein (DUF39 family)
MSVASPVTVPEAESMFRFWRHCRDVQKTAKHFGRDRKTIYRIKARDQWEDRDQHIKLQVQEDQNKKEAKAQIRSVDIVRKIRDELVNRLQDALSDGSYKPTVSEYVAIERLHQELGGSLSAAGAVTVNIGTGSADEQDQFDGDIGEILTVIQQRR